MRTIAIALALLAASAVSGADVNGSIEYIGEIRILNLWGSWHQMGYAQGYLMGPDIKEVFEDYFIEMAGGLGNYQYARNFVNAYFDIPTEFQEYAAGLIAGAADTISIYSDVLGRNMDVLDIYTTSSTPDVAALKGYQDVLCSSVSGWGDATSGDPQLNGSPAVSRNLDYYVDSQGTILENSILITFEPDDGQEWISFGFPGFTGCLSGMNQSGVSATLNMGNYQGTVQYTEPFVPICMALALGLSDPDFNGSGTCDVQDMLDALTEWNRANSYDIHVVANPTLAPQDSASVIAEISNRDGIAFRYSCDEPDIAPCRIILTNHHRVLRHPVYCIRYDWLMDSLTTNPDITLERLWNFMGAVGWPATPGSGGTLQTMTFIPEQLTMGLAYASLNTPSYEKAPQWIEWADIFPNHDPQGIEGSQDIQPLLLITPNPSYGQVSIVTSASTVDVSIFDTSGRLVDVPLQHVPEGFLIADLTGMPLGVYHISVVSEGAAISKELVLIR